ncbi:MAG: hypothetical protein Q4D94_10550 [Bacillota bacterium]|nr:hypothetical protein [Bacillota bacterium]
MQQFSNCLRRITLIWGIFLCLILTGCGGPSEEKIAQAQSTYTQLVEIHNQVAEAHKEISDASLDSKLVALSEKAGKIEDFNLSEMKDEDIDLLIETMNSLISSYEECLQTINDIKGQEDAAVLTPILVTLLNSTDQTFCTLTFYEKDDTSAKSNVLEETSGLGPGQSLAGLMIYRDVDNTPWILELENTDGACTEIELPVKDFDEEGEHLTLSVDPETQELKCS